MGRFVVALIICVPVLWFNEIPPLASLGRNDIGIFMSAMDVCSPRDGCGVGGT